MKRTCCVPACAFNVSGYCNGGDKYYEYSQCVFHDDKEQDMCEQTIKWHYIKEEGMPKVKGKNPKAFLIAYRQELAEFACTINGRPFYQPSGKYINVTQVALLQNHESMDGVYTPKNKFYWGPDIFDNAYAWTELPEAPEYKG